MCLFKASLNKPLLWNLCKSINPKGGTIWDVSLIKSVNDDEDPRNENALHLDMTLLFMRCVQRQGLVSNTLWYHKGDFWWPQTIFALHH